MNSNMNFIANLLENKEFSELIGELFNSKAEKMKNSELKLDNDTKLKFYGLFKVATVGKFAENNKKQPGFFDFAEKYKSQAWEKCSNLSKIEAMIEYIKLYNKVTGEKDEDFLQGCDSNSFNVNFEELDIPEDYEGNFIYSSNAKQAKKEISDYLMNSSDNEKNFYSIKEKIYNGDNITQELLREFSKNQNFDCNLFFNFSVKIKRLYGTKSSSHFRRWYELLCS